MTTVKHPKHKSARQVCPKGELALQKGFMYSHGPTFVDPVSVGSSFLVQPILPKGNTLQFGHHIVVYQTNKVNVRTLVPGWGKSPL